MHTQSKSQLIDIIVTVVLFTVALTGLYQSTQFSGRSGMWPTFVMAALLVFVGLHLINLIRKFRRPESNETEVSEPLGQGE